MKIDNSAQNTVTMIGKSSKSLTQRVTVSGTRLTLSLGSNIIPRDILELTQQPQTIHPAVAQLRDKMNEGSQQAMQIRNTLNALTRADRVGAEAQGFDPLENKQTLIDLLLSKLFGKDFKTMNVSKLKKAFNGDLPALESVNAPRVTVEEYKVRTVNIETSSVSFSTAGTVRTEDGRTIDFAMSFSMERTFYSETEITQVLAAIDPLVINLDGKGVQLTDSKFGFDLTSDGKMEQISALADGSGFLALDKNKDGKINDGNELFGTKSGDGFKDLAAYDKDGNGWIDENDSVWNDLVVWVRGADGSDKLYSLKDAGVGAIYLGNVSTDWSYRDSSNNDTAQLRKSGVYLKENGEAGTVAHIDLVV